MSAVERAVLDAIDLGELLADLDELMRIPSLGGDANETVAQEWMAERLGRLGMEVDVWPLDFAELEQHPDYCAEIERESGLGVVGSWGNDDGGRVLALNGHVDVVPIGDPADWQHPPFAATRVGDRIYGRGSADMKGGLCCALHAAKALIDSGVELRGKLCIHSVIGEEDGGCGSLATVLRGHRGDGAIIMEPTDLTITPVHAGALNFRIVVTGESAHACVREEGRSAIEAFVHIHQHLLALEAEENADRHPLFERYRLPYALSIGNLKAGDWPSSVADRLVCEGRFGLAPGADLAAARQRFESAVARAADDLPWLRDLPPRVEWWGGQFAPAEIDVDHALPQLLRQTASEVTGRTPPFEGMTYGADMRHLIHAGQTPTLMYGPGDVRRAHRPNEWVAKSELEQVARVLALTALRFCS